MKNISILLCLTLIAGCGGSFGGPAKFSTETTLLLSSIPQCDSQGHCACLPLVTGQAKPEEGIPEKYKRFEFRLPKTYSSIWVDVDEKGHYYKPGNEIDASCFYVDLLPGEHQITFHAAATDMSEGLKVALEVAEYGPSVDEIGPFWYPSFKLSCSGGNRCTKSGMKHFSEQHSKYKEGRLNPCATSRARGIEYTGRAQSDKVDHYENLTVRFTLDVGYLPAEGDPTSPDCSPGF